jgi:hypothetical protein
MRLATHQHDAGITARGWKHIINTKLASQREAGNTSSTRSWHHSMRLTHHHQHEAGIAALGWHIIINIKLASQH